MALYVVTEVRWDNRDEVEQVRWALADGASNDFIGPLHEVEVARVVEALDQGDAVVLRFRTSGGWVAGTRLRRKGLAGCDVNIEEERLEQGSTLHDLPTL